MGVAARGLVPAIGLGVLLNPLNSSMIAVAVPRLEEVFHLNFAQISWVIVVFYIVSAVAQPLMGRLSDTVGRRRLFLAGLALMFVASLAAASSSSFGWLLLFRGLQALATSMIGSVGMSIVRLSVTEGRERAVASVSVFLSGAAAFGPAVGGFLLHWLSWPSIFLVSVPFVVVSFALAWRAIPRDVTGRVKTETGARSPIRLLLRSRPLVLTNVEFILVNLVYYAFLFGFPSYLQGLRHLDAFQVGLLMLALGTGALVASAVAGRWIEKAGPKSVLLISGGALALGSASLAVFGSSTPVAVLAVTLFTVGVAGGLNNVGLQVALFRATPPAISGLASGVFLTARYGGAILASLVLDLAFPQGPTVSGLLILSVALVAATLVHLALMLAHRYESVGTEETADVS